MKEMIKKLIAIVICFSMISIPTVGVGADAELISITEDLTQATSADGWSTRFTAGSLTTVDFVQGSGYQMLRTTDGEKGADSTAFIQKEFALVTEDNKNKTVTTLDKFQGLYELNMDITTNVKTIAGQNDAFFVIYVGGKSGDNYELNADNDITVMRVRPTSIQLYDGSSSYSVYSAVANHNISLTVNTVTKELEMIVDGRTDKKVSASFSSDMSDLNYINTISIGDMLRMAKDSSLTVNKVSLTEKTSEYNTASTATKAVLSSLPEKLADNVDNVTENITLDTINGVKWSSSDEDVISSTGVVNRGTEDKTVTVTATVDLNNNGGVYKKAYTMKVPKKEETPGGDDGGDTGDNTGGGTSTPGNFITIVEDLRGYDSVEDLADGWSSIQLDGATGSISIGENGGYQIKQGSSSDSKTGTSTSIIQKFFKTETKDEENGTVTTLDKFQGKYEVVIDYDMSLSTIDGGSEPFYYMYFAGIDNESTEINNDNDIVTLRTRSNRVQPYTSKTLSTVNLNDGTSHTSSIVFDTKEKTVEATIDGVKGKISSDYFASNANYINSLAIGDMVRMAEGSYINVQKVTLKELESEYNAARLDTEAVVNALPAKLTTGDVNNVTENITLDTINGVTWSSSDEDVISSTGVVTRAATDKVVTITATIDLNNNGGIYKKAYTMTVPKEAEQGGDTPDPTPGNMIVVEEDYTKYNGFSMVPYSYAVTEIEPVTSKVVADSQGLGLIQTASVPLSDGDTTNGTVVPKVTHAIEGNIEEDAANRTAIRLNRFSGNFKMTVWFKTNVDTYTTTNSEGASVDIGSFYQLYFGQITDMNQPSTVSGNVIFTRLRKAYSNIYNNASAGASSLLPNLRLDHNKNNEYQKLELLFDTDKSEVEANIDDYYNDRLNAGPISKTSYINAFTAMGMQRMKAGTYLYIKKIKIEYLKEDPELEEARKALNALPASLVTDPYAVTENVDLPKAEFITWSTSDKDVITKDGVINKWYVDRDVVLTATYKKDDVLLMKDYILTVKAVDSYESEEVFNITVSDNDDLDEWSYTKADGVTMGNMSASASGLTVTKVTAAEDTNTDEENPVYTAESKLYTEEVAYNSSTHSALYSSGYSGLYFFDFDLTSNVNGSVPVKINLGRYVGGEFVKAIGLNVFNKGINAEYVNDVENKTARIYTGETSGKSFDIRFCIDTVNKKAWAFVDGQLMTTAIDFDGTGIEYLFDTLQVVIDKNNSVNDSITINNFKLEALETNTVVVKESLIALAQSLTVDKVTADLPTKVGSIKELPETVDGAPVVWSSNSDLVDLTTGTIYYDTTAKDVVISAYITKGGFTVRKDFHLTIRESSGNSEILEYLAHKLEGAITKQNTDNIRYDINLPTSYEGMTIIWSSSDELIIDNNGVVNKNAGSITSATDVTLTANISYNGTNTTKTFKYKVAQMSGENDVYSGTTLPQSFTVNGTDNIVLSGDSHTYLTLSQTGCNDGNISFVDAEGNVIIQMIINDNSYYFDYTGTDYAMYPMPEGTDLNLEMVIMPEKDKFAVWADGVRIIDYADFISSADNYAGVTATGTGLNVSNAKVTVDDYGMLNINFDNVDYFANMSKRVLKESITLENSVIIPARVEWESSDTSLITHEGIVKTPNIYGFATMTLTLYYGSDENVFKTVSKDVAIACDISKNLMSGTEISSSTVDMTGHMTTEMVDKDFNTSFACVGANKQPEIKIDFGKAVYVNALYLNEDFESYEWGIKKYTVAYSNDNQVWTTVKTGDITNTASNLITFDTVNARYLKFTIIESDVKTVYINELEAYFNASPEELIQFDINSVNLDLGYSVTENITLPQKGANGTAFTWTSSNPSVISSNGVVIRPAEGTNVTLTVSASYKGKTFSKAFTVYVSGAGSTGGTVIDGGGSGGGGGGASGGGATQAPVSTVPGFVETVPEDTAEENVSQPETVFFDVPATHWAFEAINTLKELGIVDGDGTGNFNPSSLVTREQYLKMLVETAGTEISGTDTQFEDVNPLMWYAPYIKAGVDAGLINGISADTFGVGADIKRCDMAVMMYRILKQKGIQVELSAEKFADDELVPEYAKEAVYAVRGAGIIQGYNNMFNPTDSLTRAEAATVLMKFIELIQ